MEIKNTSGEIIYKDDSKTIKETVENAVKKGVNLSWANLSGADLSRADLSGAILSWADLSWANLSGARLLGVMLSNEILSKAIKTPIHCRWNHGITDNKISIGCETRTIQEWKDFLKSDEEIQTPRDSKDFKQIEAVINAYIAYLETLNK